MNVKRYIAADTSEAMIKIKHDLGSDAIILNTRKIRKKGLAGLFGKKLVEVVVAVDDFQKHDKSYKPPHKQDNRQEAIKTIHDVTNQTVETKSREEELNKQNIQLQSELGDLKSLVSDLVSQMKVLKDEVHHFDEPNMSQTLDNMVRDTLSVTSNKIDCEEESEFYQNMRQKLKQKYVTDETIDMIFNSFKHSDNDIITEKNIKMAMKQILQPVSNIKIGGKNQILLFAGPTGVGKTTTLAKLAAKLALIDGCSIGLITADTFRIAAVDQLRTYSEILGIPFTVIYEPEELEGVLDAYKDKDFILIDTAGRSHKSKELKNDLSQLLSYLKNVQVFLVMSLTTGYNDMVSIVRSYSFIKNYKLIFTKLDESDSIANILNIKAHCPAALSYFTTGQNVPEDIEMASIDKIIDAIMEEDHGSST